jgi:hypothetical protein
MVVVGSQNLLWTNLNAFDIRYGHATRIYGVTSNLCTFCCLPYKRVLHHGSLHTEQFSRFKICTEAHVGGI